MAKAIPNPEPAPREPLGSHGGSSQLSPLEAWGNEDLLDKESQQVDTPSDLQREDRPETELPSLGEDLSSAPAINDDSVRQLQAENEELRSIIAEYQQELEAASGKIENDWAERQKEFDSLLDEKTELIRASHLEIQELKEQIRPPTPKEDELLAMSEDLERERCLIQQERRKLDEEMRQLKEDSEVMTEEMRKMEMQMAKERAELARQRNDLTRLSDELKQELERIERDGGLSDKLADLRKRHQETVRGRTTMAPTSAPRPPASARPPASPTVPAKTQLSIDLETPSADKPAADKAEGDPKKKDSGLFRRFFGQGGG